MTDRIQRESVIKKFDVPQDVDHKTKNKRPKTEGITIGDALKEKVKSLLASLGKINIQALKKEIESINKGEVMKDPICKVADLNNEEVNGLLEVINLLCENGQETPK
jgi:hypothetical protein